MEIGKLPPQSIELEEAVLGAMLLENEALETVLPILKKESFYKEKNGLIYQAMLNLYKSNSPIDILTVTSELRKNGNLEMVGGSYAVSALTNRIASSANVEFHARIVEQNFMKRELIRIGTSAIKEAYDDSSDIFDLLENIDKELLTVTNDISSNSAENIKTIKDRVIDKSKEVLKNGTQSGIPSSIQKLNEITNGWQNGDLIILGGRPSMGKTSLAIDFLLHPALNGKKTVLFSLETSKEKIASRIMSHVSEMKLQNISNSKLNLLDITNLEENTTILNNIGLFIDDTPGLTSTQLRSKARRLKKLQGIELIVIDYLQLMELGGKSKMNREQEISTISRGLKKLSKELGIPIIALSQLSRKVEERPSRKPQLSDLRESGSIEQDADMIMFAFRPEYYGFNEYEVGGTNWDAKDLMIIIVAKFKDGKTGDIKSKWEPELAMVTNFNATT